ncbi:MAG: hypothetical protein R6V02_01960 [Candidatus Aminicenantes bacterium]
MGRLPKSIIGLPNDADIENEELKEIVKNYNKIIQNLVNNLYGDLKDHEDRISDLE